MYTTARSQFATRFTLDGKLLNRKYVTKLVDVWLQDDLGWSKNTQEICKKAYSKLGMLTKLKYAGVSKADLLTIYCLFIRSKTEYCSVAFHSSLTTVQSNAIEKIQSTCLRVILKDAYKSYSHALSITGLGKGPPKKMQKCGL